MERNRAGFIAGAFVGLTLIGNCPALGADNDGGSAGLIAVGSAYTALPGAAALIWVNPAVIQLSGQRASADLSYCRLFGLGELEEVTASAWRKILHHGGGGLGFSRFGESGLYLETRAVAVASWMPSKNWAMGAGWEMQRIEFGDNDSRWGGSHVTVAAAAKPVPALLAAVAVRRLTANRIYDHDNPKPTVEFSAAWSAPPDLTLAGIWTGQEGEDQFGLGQRLRLGSAIEFLSGLTFAPIRYSLGGQITYAGGTIDYTYQSHADLGGTHVIGFGWRW